MADVFYRSALLLGILVYAALVFLNLGGGSIDLYDESLTAGRSLYVYEHESVFNYKVNGTVSTRKPPLMYILNALSFSLLGVNEFALRLPNALFGVFTVVLLAVIAVRLVGIRLAFFTPWLLMGSDEMIKVSREALTDTVFVFGFLCAVTACLLILKAQTTPRKSHPWLYLGGLVLIFFGKGPIGLFPCVWVPLFFLFVDKSKYLILLKFSFLALLPFGAWLIVQGYLNVDFVADISQETFGRLNYGSAFLSHHIEGPLFYINKLWNYFNIVAWLSVTIAFYCLFQAWKKPFREDATQTIMIFLSGTILLYLLLISIASHKHDRYILPIVPLMVLTVLVCTQYFKTESLKRMHGFLYAILISSVIIGARAQIKHYDFVPDYKPREKTAAFAIKEYSERGFPVFTNDSELATILHFYLRKEVMVVSGIDATPSENLVFVNSGAPPTGKDKLYRIIVKNKRE